MRPSIHTHPSIHPSLHSSVHPSIHPSIHSFIHPSLHPSASPHPLLIKTTPSTNLTQLHPGRPILRPPRPAPPLRRRQHRHPKLLHRPRRLRPHERCLQRRHPRPGQQSAMFHFSARAGGGAVDGDGVVRECDGGGAAAYCECGGESEGVGVSAVGGSG